MHSLDLNFIGKNILRDESIRVLCVHMYSDTFTSPWVDIQKQHCTLQVSVWASARVCIPPLLSSHRRLTSLWRRNRKIAYVTEISHWHFSSFSFALAQTDSHSQGHSHHTVISTLNDNLHGTHSYGGVLAPHNSDREKRCRTFFAARDFVPKSFSKANWIHFSWIECALPTHRWEKRRYFHQKGTYKHPQTDSHSINLFIVWYIYTLSVCIYFANRRHRRRHN